MRHRFNRKTSYSLLYIQHNTAIVFIRGSVVAGDPATLYVN